MVRGLTQTALAAFLAAASALAGEPPTNSFKQVPIGGRILTMDEQPIAGARVFLRPYRNSDEKHAVHSTVSDRDGSFQFLIKKYPSESAFSHPHELVVVADNYSPKACSWSSDTSRDTIHLEQDASLLEGKIVSLEGRPLEGVRVQVESIYFNEAGNLAKVIQNLQNPAQALSQSSSPTPIPLAELGIRRSATTNKQGRFQLKNIGSERITHLQIEGAAIQTEQILVLMRSGPRPNAVTKVHVGGLPDAPLHAASFTHPVSPSSPVEGIVRDRDTGKPISGITVYGVDFPFCRARTDHEGRYRLTGLPLKNRLIATAEEGTPNYFHETPELPESRLNEITRFDINLQRGIAVHGRVTDKGTGKSARAVVHYQPLPNNPIVKRLEREVASEAVPSESDGSYSLLVLPGPGIISAAAVSTKFDFGGRYSYLMGQGVEEVSRQFREVTPEDLKFLRRQKNVVVPIDLPANAQSPTRDLVLDPGLRVTGRFIGPDGKPLHNVHIRGPMIQGDDEANTTRQLGSPESANFSLTGFDGKQPRLFRFERREMKLKTALYLKGNEPKGFAVQLQPAARIRFKTVDAKGGFVVGLVQDSYGKNPPLESEIAHFADFRFIDRGEIEVSVPGGVEVTIDMKAESNDEVEKQERMVRICKNLVLKPGEVRDLGKILIKFSGD